MKTLIIRLDKLGDFYITLPYINSIKRTFGKKNIDILLSERIFHHFKEKDYLFNKIYFYPNKSLIKRIFLIYKLRLTKYENIVVFDGKDKSLIITLFLNGINKILVLEKKKKNIFIKLLVLLKKKYHIKLNNLIDSYHVIFEDVLNTLKIKFNEKDFSFLKFESLNTLNSSISEIYNLKNYTLMHIDEKWFSNLYINEYEDFNLTNENLLSFFKKIVSERKKNLVITTGIVKIKFLDDFIKANFTKLHDKLYKFEKDGFKVFFINETNIKDLEILIMNSSNLITCNGPLTQVASSFGINVIDIVEKKLENWYGRHISNKKGYNNLFRKDFNKLSGEILNKIK